MKTLCPVPPTLAPVVASPKARNATGLHLIGDLYGCLCDSRLMHDAIDRLNPGGRLAVITFHSLEDRIVKNAMQAAAKGCTCPPEFPVCICGKKPKVRVLTRKPIVSGAQELAENPRARSAKLRVAEKL